MNLRETKRYYNALSEIRVKCPCSHTMFFPSYGPDIQICSTADIRSIETTK